MSKVSTHNTFLIRDLLPSEAQSQPCCLGLIGDYLKGFAQWNNQHAASGNPIEWPTPSPSGGQVLKRSNKPPALGQQAKPNPSLAHDHSHNHHRHDHEIIQQNRWRSASHLKQPHLASCPPAGDLREELLHSPEVIDLSLANRGRDCGQSGNLESGERSGASKSAAGQSEPPERRVKTRRTRGARLVELAADENRAGQEETRIKRTRTMFNEWQLGELEWRFSRNKYLITSDRHRIAKLLNLDQLQVKTWFQVSVVG